MGRKESRPLILAQMQGSPVFFRERKLRQQRIRGDINGDGEVSYIMIQGGQENIDTQYRTAYSVKALEEAGVETRSFWIRQENWSQSQGQKIMEEALDEFGNDIEVVFCNNDAMALGALEAIGRQTEQ